MSGGREIVSAAEWSQALAEQIDAEKRHMRAADRLAAARRRLPMTPVDKDYVFDGPSGPVGLADLFEGRRQLLLYHFMFGPDWEAGCDGCSMVVDCFPHPAHLHARDATLALVSRAPRDTLEAYRQRMGWELPWYSSHGTDFNHDFGTTDDEGGESFGLSVFLEEDGRIFRTYFTERRALESLGTTWDLLDLTPFGRQEDWEDAPPGVPQGPAYGWWRRHDEYGDQQPPSRHEAD